jgi:hypothetical protein
MLCSHSLLRIYIMRTHNLHCLARPYFAGRHRILDDGCFPFRKPFHTSKEIVLRSHQFMNCFVNNLVEPSWHSGSEKRGTFIGALFETNVTPPSQ